MHLKEQLKLQQLATYRNRLAVQALVLDKVDWLEKGWYNRQPYRIGLIPEYGLIILHNIDEEQRKGVYVLSTDEAAAWPVKLVEAFPKLDQFLRDHCDLESPISFADYPPECWRRSVKPEVAQ